MLKDLPLEPGSAVPQYGIFQSQHREFENSIREAVSSKIVYRLEKKWKMLITSYGLERDSDIEKSKCIFVVNGDGKELFRSHEIKDSYDRMLKLDVSDVDRLELNLIPVSNNTNGHGVWFMPSVSRHDFVAPNDIREFFDRIDEDTTISQVEEWVRQLRNVKASGAGYQVDRNSKMVIARHWPIESGNWMIYLHFQALDGTQNDNKASKEDSGNYIISAKSMSFRFDIQKRPGSSRSHLVESDNFGYIPRNLKREEVEQFRAARKLFLNIPGAKLKTELSSHPGSWSSFGQFTPDSKKFIAVSRSKGGSNVFDIASGKVVAKVNYPRNMNRVDIHPNGKIAVSGSEGGKVIFWNIKNGSIVREIPAHADDSFIDAIRFSPDGSFVASGASDRTAATWDTETGKERMRFKGHSDIIWTVDISPDNKTLATCSNDGNVILWDVNTGKQLHCLKGIHVNNHIRGLAFNHKGTILASGSSDRTVVFWDVKSGKYLSKLTGSEGEIVDVAFSPDDSKIVIGCMYSNFSSVWNIETGMPLYRVSFLNHVNKGWDHTAVFSPDGKTIATCSHDPIRIWSVPTDEELKQWKENLENERKTAKEIPLAKIPLERAQAAWETWGIETLPLAGKNVENSLWAHAPSRYVFRLDRTWKIFQTTYGVPERDKVRADLTNYNATNCIFIVKADGKEIFRSEEIKDKEVRNIRLNVNNVDKLELIVDPNGPADYDRAIWATPMLSR